MIRETFAVGALGCNCTIIGDLVSRQALVIDPGGEAARILKTLAEHQLHVLAVLHTHAHIDHVGATASVCESTGAKAFLHEEDTMLYDSLALQAHMIGLPEPARWAMENLVDGEAKRAGTIELGVMHTPGHTMGSCSFLLEKAGLVLSGDTIFRRGVGRTDLGGDWPLLQRSIRERFYTLKDDVVVIPGHGPETTIGEERRLNPYVQG